MFAIVLITAPKKNAKTIAMAIVKDRLAACVNILPSVSSYFWWRGKVEADEEAMLLIKTRMDLVNRLIDKTKEIHPYELPEIIAIPLVQGSPPYLQWIREETTP